MSTPSRLASVTRSRLVTARGRVVPTLETLSRAARSALRNRGKSEDARVDELRQLDEQRRTLIMHGEQLKNERNRVTKEIGALKAKGQNADDKMAAMKKVGEEIAAIDKQLVQLEESLRGILLNTPNLPDASVPIGKDAADFASKVDQAIQENYPQLQKRRIAYAAANTWTRIISRPWGPPGSNAV